MNQKLVQKNRTLECSNCGEVTFRYIERQFFADEISNPVAANVDRVLNYGKCQVAAAAKVPGNPILSEIENCPLHHEFK